MPGLHLSPPSRNHSETNFDTLVFSNHFLNPHIIAIHLDHDEPIWRDLFLSAVEKFKEVDTATFLRSVIDQPQDPKSMHTFGSFREERIGRLLDGSYCSGILESAYHTVLTELWENSNTTGNKTINWGYLAQRVGINGTSTRIVCEVLLADGPYQKEGIVLIKKLAAYELQPNRPILVAQLSRFFEPTDSDLFITILRRCCESGPQNSKPSYTVAALARAIPRMIKSQTLEPTDKTFLDEIFRIVSRHEAPLISKETSRDELFGELASALLGNSGVREYLEAKIYSCEIVKEFHLQSIQQKQSVTWLSLLGAAARRGDIWSLESLITFSLQSSFERQAREELQKTILAYTGLRQSPNESAMTVGRLEPINASEALTGAWQAIIEPKDKLSLASKVIKWFHQDKFKDIGLG